MILVSHSWLSALPVLSSSSAWLGCNDLNTLWLDDPVFIRLWLDGPESLPWNSIPLVNITMVAFQLVFASETIVSAVFASDNRTWVFDGIGAVSNCVVTPEICEILGSGLASFKAVIFPEIAEMPSLMVNGLRSRSAKGLCNLLLTTRKSAYKSGLSISRQVPEDVGLT